jgi:hypothetical protein
MMTVEQARDRVNGLWVLRLQEPGEDPWPDLKERIAQEFVRIDNEAEKKALEFTLEWALTWCGGSGRGD